jgi:Sulfotransferase family
LTSRSTIDLTATYREIDRLLQHRAAGYPKRPEPVWTQLVTTIERVAAELWESGAAAPAAEDAPEPFAERPVFVVGYYKSGTTLLLSLLDGHPDLVVLPGESRHFSGFLAATADLPAGERLQRLHKSWIRNLITPYGLPPYWLLGEPWQTADDPYLGFTRELIRRGRARAGRDLLAAVAQALAATAGTSPSRWVEKTPTHEFHLDRILAAYPHASFLHVVRAPRATMGSLLQYEADRPVVEPWLGAVELGRSLQTALDGRTRLGDRYHVVRYEDLVADTDSSMRTVADTLGIPFDESLLTPTTGGKATTANAGRPERRVVGTVHRLSADNGPALPRRVAAAVDAFAGVPARALGYDTPRGTAPVRTGVRAVLSVRHRLRAR